MKEKLIYWISTGIFSAMMLFSAYSYFTNAEIEASFTHLGFPDYFRVELGLAKAIGALVLIIPMIPVQLKEWAYAGFAITFVSAAIAHTSNQDPTSMVVAPLVFLAILAVSRIYLAKTTKPLLS